MLGPDEPVIEEACFFLCQHKDAAAPVGEALEHRSKLATRRSSGLFAVAEHRPQITRTHPLPTCDPLYMGSPRTPPRGSLTNWLDPFDGLHSIK